MARREKHRLLMSKIYSPRYFAMVAVGHGGERYPKLSLASPQQEFTAGSIHSARNAAVLLWLVLMMWTACIAPANAALFGTEIVGGLAEYAPSNYVIATSQNGPNVNLGASATTMYTYENRSGSVFPVAGSTTVVDPIYSGLLWYMTFIAPPSPGALAFLRGDADLRTGWLNALAFSTVSAGIDPGSFSSVMAQLFDVITIDAPASMLDHGFYVSISTVLSGNISLNESGLGSGLYVFYTYTPASESLGQKVVLKGGIQTVTNTVFVDSQYNEIDLFAQLELMAENGAILDYADTARISVSLPEGASFSSASGVFLSQSPTEVPEPSSMSILSSSLLATLAVTASSLISRTKQKTR